MNKLSGIAGVVGLAIILWSNSLMAQMDALPNFAAIEAFQCKYKEEMNRADLNDVVIKWNKWMDETKGAPYVAWILTPYFINANMDVDVIWLGAWQNGMEMGKGIQEWVTGGGAMGAEFDAVVDCPGHSNSASLNLRPPQRGEWPAETGVVVFANCSVAEGKTIGEAMAAHRSWVKHLDMIGSKAAMWAFFPGFGGTDSDWDYKIVTSHPDYFSLGADWEAYTNGQGWAKLREIMQGIVSCDSPRVYNSTTVRDSGINPAP